MMLIAGAGGFAGTCARFLIGRLCSAAGLGGLPVATFVVNIAGCFLIGLFMGLGERLQVLTSAHGALLVTGFCGGFTTFSAFANEIWSLGNRGEWCLSALYAGGSIVSGVAMVIAGRLLVR